MTATPLARSSSLQGIAGHHQAGGTTPPEPVWLLGGKPLPPINDYQWELYNVAEDYSQNNDLAAKNPAKLKEMQALFLTEAKKYQVLPLDNSILPRLVTPRPSATAGQTVCWPGPALLGMLTYNALGTAYFAWLALGGIWTGPLLWPAVGLHAVLTVLLARARLKRPKPGE